jgi:hypothetical protein
MSKKSWLEELSTPVIEIKAVGSAEPVRGYTHFNKSAPAARVQGHCLPGRRSHSWLNGRCYWCNAPRGKR